VRHDDRLSAGQVLLWTTLGMGAGLVAGFALSEWVGGVSPTRMRRAADRFGRASPARLTAAAAVRAAQTALLAEPRLAGLTIEVMPVARAAVELRGWVPSRIMRALAGRTVLAASGIESVINSLQVRGEDDEARADDKHATDQSA
jgi:osmotically-inducible protein OsmY